ncbi:hypothetical protein PHMEG_000406 [Phytophthora megakarya]|uniref:Uncharacterized protein n=1 Tax=Phytophthora megakarya TaxID=4795 RepID=A0A225X5G4_9STRA|nr:hypothetical protein PHMEG_000406 [Phytophthora megakarya]
MQALSSNELVKTLRDQLTLTSKSEEQLKLQTKQLMEQNQSLQADLLEKIASETSKFQKMAKLSAENESLVEELEQSGSELQLVKHGFIATVIRDTERGWLRMVLSQWRMQTHVSVVTKELKLQVEMAELKAAERDKYSKSLDDYSRVLRNDLERFQFFSLDKRITVDVLSKKLLREEERYRHMEERHVALEEKAHTLKTQLASFVEWDGLVLPFSVLALCKDVAVNNLRELFQLHAAADNAVVAEVGSTRSGDGETPSPRLAMTSLVRILEYSTLLEEKVIEREALSERLAHNTKHEQLKRFWASLLSLLGAAHGHSGVAAGNSTSVNARSVPNGEIGASLMLGPTHASWAGHLSDDILQNQEKLLAVLEHETAVVERAVMEKASLKNTYQSTDRTSTGSIITRSGSASSSAFREYQCDPLLPPGSPSHSAAVTPSTMNSVNQVPRGADPNVPSAGGTAGFSIEAYANWHLAPQVRDLFLAFHAPLLKLLVQYSGGKRTPALGNQYCLTPAAVFRMFTDFKLHPTFLSKDFIQSLFERFRETGDVGIVGGLLAPQGFTLLVGSCALELYARSLAGSKTKPEFLLSAREILLSYFGDLGLLTESDVPAASRLCFVGTDVETILWPLFEYYAKSTDGSESAGATRVGMSINTFERFMSDIAGKAAGDSHTIFCRVRQDLRKNQDRVSGTDNQQWSMRLDEFYIAISYVQAERCPGIAYSTPGEAVRQWLQQTQ